jgi:2'-hydroxyisoflavone reductase
MKILLLGGTQFIGRHVAQELLLQGHQLTLLNRGRTDPDAFRDLPLIRMDREMEDPVEKPELRGDWDAIVDLTAYYPESLSQLLSFMKGRAGRYVQCSTLSAYIASTLDDPTPMIDEDDPLRSCTTQEAKDSSMATYGQRKAECERVAMSQHSDGIPVVILRPCVVYGEKDHTDRMAYWIWRAHQNKSFILPDAGLTIVRRTYAPDLARAFASSLTASAAPGNAYNIAETDPLSFRDTLFHLGHHLGTHPLEHAVSMDADHLMAKGIKPWTDLPMWLPRKNLLVDTFKARRDLGYLSTPPSAALAQAADAFLALKRAPKTGLTQEKEARILESP